MIRRGFDLPSFVDRAFSQLKSDIDLTSEVSIGERWLHLYCVCGTEHSCQATILQRCHLVNAPFLSKQMPACTCCCPH